MIKKCSRQGAGRIMSQWLCQLLLVWMITQLLPEMQTASSPTGRLGTCNLENVSNSQMKHNSSIIYLLTLLPYPQPLSGNRDTNSLQPRGADILLPAAELAVQHVNQDASILPGYRVELVNAEAGCDVTTTRTLVSYFKYALNSGSAHSRSPGPIAGIIGPTCSESTITVSSITGRATAAEGLALPNVHIASSAELEDRGKYPYTFGVLGSTSQLVEAVFTFIHHNQWNMVAVLYDDSRASFYANSRLKEIIQNEKLVAFHSPVYDTFFPFESLKRSEAKIVAVMSTLMFAQRILCIAYHEEITFPDYQWIIVGHGHGEFTESNTTFYYDGRHYECNWSTEGSKDATLDYTLFIHFRLLEMNKSLPLVSGYTYSKIEQQYEERVRLQNSNGVCSFTTVPNMLPWAAVTYDALWALVLALNTTASAADNEFVDTVTINKLKEKLSEVDFMGASGRIQFDRGTGFVQRMVDISQIYNGTASSVGYIFRGNISLSSNDSHTIFITTSQPRYDSVNYFVAAFFTLIELVLLLVTAFIHIVTLVYREFPSVKASSLSLNQFVFLGCYTLGVVEILYIWTLKTLGASVPAFKYISTACHAIWAWLIPIAITLIFGILIAKTWRIYRIFIHFREPGPLISTKALTMIVLVQLGIDVIIGTAWSIVSPMELVEVTDSEGESNIKQDVISRQCVYTNKEYWLPVFGMYKLIQTLALLALCLMTRSVKNKRFSTASLSTASYLCLSLTAALLPIYTLLWLTNAEIHADFVVLCLLLSGNGFVLLAFVLLPPVLPILTRHIHCR